MTQDDTLPVFIFEPQRDAREGAVAVWAEAGYEVVQAGTAEEATAILEEGARLSLVLLPATSAGNELAQYIKDFSDIRAPVVVTVRADESVPRQRADEMGAVAYLRAPFSVGAVEMLLQLAPELALLRQRVDQIPEAEQGEPAAKLTTRTGFHQFEDVKDLLVVEVRRAKRYGYPLSLLLIRLDPIPALQQIDRPELPREITGGLAVAISRSVRVIDLPIHYADDSILVFLPHTDLAGAEEVGRRIKRRIKRITYRDEALTCQLTASVGVAGVSAGDNLTFSKLIKNAASALRVAQLKGGDRVMKRFANPTSRLEPLDTSAATEILAVETPLDDDFDGGPTLTSKAALVALDTIIGEPADEAAADGGAPDEGMPIVEAVDGEADKADEGDKSDKSDGAAR